MLSTIGVHVLSAVIFGIGLILIGFVYEILHVQQEEDEDDDDVNVPPGSMGWPLLGHTLSFLEPHNSNSIGNFLQDSCSRYGTVFKSHLFGKPTIVSCDVELNALILQNEGKLFCSSYPRSVRDILGSSSLLLVAGELHKRIRSVPVNFLNTSKLTPQFLSYIQTSSIKMMESWKDGSQILFHQQAKELAFYLIIKNALDLEHGEEHVAELLEGFLTFMKGFVSLPLNFPGTSYAKAMKARPRVFSTIREILISERPKRINSGLIIEEIMDKGELNDEEKVNIMFDLLLAGYETTSALMALVLYFLAHSPSALQQLKEEHELVRSEKGGEPLTLQDYKQMNFTSKVVNESLRCGNVVKFVHREALKDVKYKDYIIPSGWQVLPILSAVHLDPSLHQNPSQFNPWRWDDETTGRKVTPFGGGIRLCPGAELAKIETAFFLHHLLLNFRWKIKADECPLSYPFLEFKRGLLLEVERIAIG